MFSTCLETGPDQMVHEEKTGSCQNSSKWL